MKQRRAKKRKRHFVFNVKDHEPISIFDIYSRMEIELQVYQKDGGGLAIDFLLPGSMRIARGSLN